MKSTYVFEDTRYVSVIGFSSRTFRCMYKKIHLYKWIIMKCFYVPNPMWNPSLAALETVKRHCVPFANLFFFIMVEIDSNFVETPTTQLTHHNKHSVSNQGKTNVQPNLDFFGKSLVKPVPGLIFAPSPTSTRQTWVIPSAPEVSVLVFPVLALVIWCVNRFVIPVSPATGH